MIKSIDQKSEATQGVDGEEVEAPFGKVRRKGAVPVLLTFTGVLPDVGADAVVRKGNVDNSIAPGGEKNHPSSQMGGHVRGRPRDQAVGQTRPPPRVVLPQGTACGVPASVPHRGRSTSKPLKLIRICKETG